MRTLPFTLPSAYKVKPGTVVVPSDVDVGGYDFMIGGHGFRLATDTQFAYQRATEPTTVHRFDSSAEPGEQSLSALPWVKSQSSFHAGAGQLNLEQGFTAFQYQQEQVEHIRFDTCLGVDCWTPGKVSRLPDTSFFNFGFNASTMVTATVSGIDYAVIGGSGGLYQAAWLSGPDSAPTVTAIDLTGSTYGGASNCNVTSLATDGTNYFGVIQLTSAGYVAGVLTYIISGQVGSTAAPLALYEVPNSTGGSPRTNLCTNPNFEGGTTAGWAGAGTPAPTLAISTVQAHSGTQSMKVTTTGVASFLPNATFNFPVTNGSTYEASAWVWVPTGSPAVVLGIGSTLGAASTIFNAWQRLTVTYAATSTGTQNFTIVQSGTAAGQFFYADDVLIEAGADLGSYFDGDTAATSTYTFAWTGTAHASTSTATPIIVPVQMPGTVGWAKARLVGALGAKVYELPVNVASHAALPTARYTYPSSGWLWSDIAESPTGILASGTLGGQSSILEFTLDTSGGTPFLSGGVSIATLPPGEIIYNIQSYLSSYLAIGTTRGIRVGTFDTYTGALKYGPLAVETTAGVLGLTGRDRFIYGSYSNQQADGKTGLVRVDLSMIVDAAGRNAWAPDLRPPTTAPTGLGAVTCVGQLPLSNRIIFLTPEGIHVEGNGPGNDGDAWIRTSRIRYDTAEMKLFKLGRLHGSLDVANIQVTGIAPYRSDQNLGTFGFIASGDPGEFRLPGGLNEWIQLKFDLVGSACVFNSYQVKALPAPHRQHVITLTANCFQNETDRFGLDVTDPETPRVRLQNVVDLEAAGDEVRFVEFTNSGAVAQLVVIDQLAYQSFSRPNIEDDFGGYITLKLRSTES
jgi:hypothetical protein